MTVNYFFLRNAKYYQTNKNCFLMSSKKNFEISLVLIVTK